MDVYTPAYLPYVFQTYAGLFSRKCKKVVADDVTPVAEQPRLPSLPQATVPQRRPQSIGIPAEVSLEAGVDYSLHYVTFLVRIRLKEGIGLAVRDASGSSDPYVRFKYKERIVYKSNTIFKNLNPVWDEEFSMLVDDITNPDCDRGEELGQIALSLSIMPQTQEEKEQFLQKSRGGVLSSQEVKAQRLVQIWARSSVMVLVEAKEKHRRPAPGAPDLNTASSRSSARRSTRARQSHLQDRRPQVDRAELRYSHQCLKEVGHLTVKVFRAENLIAKDLGGKSDPFAVLELVSCRHGCPGAPKYKTLSPHWNKLFIFSVRDIHTCLEVTVYDVGRTTEFEFLGPVSIPLVTIRNCAKKWFALKDKKLTNRVRGDILLELDLIWNPIRAAIRTFNPREQKYIQPEHKFKPAQFKARCSFIITVYNFQLHHAPIVILLLFLKGYVYRRIADGLSHGKRWEERGLSAGGNSVDEDDEGELIIPTKQKAEASSSLRDTFFSVQETLQVVQGVLVFINELLQRIKNTFNFTNPWLSWLAVVVLTVATGLLYLVPLRWIIMVWGINKFTKKLRNPHYVDNNELLDYLSRVPSDTEIQQWRELPVEPKKPAKEKTSK
ncbi:unnamed protein product, partial [Mesorhabditis spiculigera]